MPLHGWCTQSHKPKMVRLLQQTCKKTNSVTNGWCSGGAAAGAGGQERPERLDVPRQKERRQKGAELQGDPCTCNRDADVPHSPG